MLHDAKFSKSQASDTLKCILQSYWILQSITYVWVPLLENSDSTHWCLYQGFCKFFFINGYEALQYYSQEHHRKNPFVFRPESSKFIQVGQI